MKRIYFDLDGPIIDVAPKFYQIYTDLFGKAGFPTLSSAEYWDCKRRRVPEPQIVALTAPPEFIEPYMRDRIAVIENIEYLRHDGIIDGAIAVLSNLRRQHELVLVTLRNRRANLMWELDYFDLKKYFSAILTREDNHGDHKVKIELIREYTQSPQAAGMIIGDTESDIRAGQELGLRTVAVTCGIRTKELLQALNPDYIIDSMNQLLPIVEREFSR